MTNLPWLQGCSFKYIYFLMLLHFYDKLYRLLLMRTAGRGNFGKFCREGEGQLRWPWADRGGRLAPVRLSSRHVSLPDKADLEPGTL